MQRVINLLTGEETTSEALPPVALPSAAELALASIIELEASVTQRRLREAASTEEGRLWLQNVESQIALERAKL